jgi:nucleoside-diphosphate-sugar epimerase
MQQAPLLFCFGLGFSAMATAKRLSALGFRVAGTARSEASLAKLRAQGIAVQAFDWDRPLADPSVLNQAHAILSSIAPDERGDPVIAHHGAVLAKSPAWRGYLSTTGVYGDAGGAWVDERADRAARSPRGLARIAAEDQWLSVGAEIFRLAGIYGPGRNQLESLRDGTAKRLVKPGQVFSRIHVDDIAQAVTAAIGRPSPGAVYNVADDEPAPPQNVVAYGAQLLGIDPPPEQSFESARAHLSPMALSFYADNKRIDNRKLKRDLGLRLIHPTYRQGLSACLSSLAPSAGAVKPSGPT